MKYVIEPERKLEVKEAYDVVVVGGGIAGVAAALAARRNGAKTLLIEKQFALGGLATLGLVTIYLALCDGRGTQVSYGIAEELFKLSMKHGAEGRVPTLWLSEHTREERAAGERYEVQFSANVYAILCEQILKDEGVTILYGTSVCAVDAADAKLTAVVVENKSGRYAIGAKSVVDASGDADVCALAGETTAVYGPRNVLAAWYYATENNENRLHMLGFAELPVGEKSDDSDRPLVPKRFGGIDGEEISDMIQIGHDKILEDFLRGGGVTPSHSLSAIAGIPQLRMTRRLVGVTDIASASDHTYVADSVGMIANWRKRGPVFEVPFTCLYGRKVKNLITAGRCISASDDIWDATRVIPCCAVTGQAAGSAASMTDDFSALPIETLQKHLAENGVVLHGKDLGLF